MRPDGDCLARLRQFTPLRVLTLGTKIAAVPFDLRSTLGGCYHTREFRPILAEALGASSWLKCISCRARGHKTGCNYPDGCLI
jgi:hypothetical protein